MSKEDLAKLEKAKKGLIKKAPGLIRSVEGAKSKLSDILNTLFEYMQFVSAKTVLGCHHFKPYIHFFAALPPPRSFDEIISDLIPGKPETLESVRHDLFSTLAVF